MTLNLLVFLGLKNQQSQKPSSFQLLQSSQLQSHPLHTHQTHLHQMHPYQIHPHQLKRQANLVSIYSILIKSGVNISVTFLTLFVNSTMIVVPIDSRYIHDEPDESIKLPITYSPQHQQFQNHHNHELSQVPFSELYKALKATEPKSTQHHDLSAINEGVCFFFVYFITFISLSLTEHFKTFLFLLCI